MTVHMALGLSLSPLAGENGQPCHLGVRRRHISHVRTALPRQQMGSNGDEVESNPTTDAGKTMTRTTGVTRLVSKNEDASMIPYLSQIRIYGD